MSLKYYFIIFWDKDFLKQSSTSAGQVYIRSIYERTLRFHGKILSHILYNSSLVKIIII